MKSVGKLHLDKLKGGISGIEFSIPKAKIVEI
jgi:hypothetical protein